MAPIPPPPPGASDAAWEAYTRQSMISVWIMLILGASVILALAVLFVIAAQLTGGK
jgi:hypothetical protein